MLSNGNSKKRAHPIVETPNMWMLNESFLVFASIVPVAFIAEVLDNLIRIQGNSNVARIGSDAAQGIVEWAANLLAPKSRCRVPIAHGLVPKAKVSGVFRKCPSQSKVYKFLWTPVIVNDHLVHGADWFVLLGDLLAYLPVEPSTVEPVHRLEWRTRRCRVSAMFTILMG